MTSDLLVRIREDMRERIHGLAIEAHGAGFVGALVGFPFCRTLRFPLLKKSPIETVETMAHLPASICFMMVPREEVERDREERAEA